MGFQEEPSGGGSATPRTFTSASTPTVAEDSSSGYRVGDKWVVTGDDGVSSGYVYECTDNSVGAALWFPPQRYPVPPAELPSAINATKIASGAVSNTEFQYLNNVSSSIQTQLDAKAPLAIGPTIAGLTSKSTPVTDDDFLISDSAASDVAKRVTYGDLLTTLQAAIGGGFSGVYAYKTSDQGSIGTGYTKITFDAERFDTGNNFASSTFTAPSTQKYLFEACVTVGNGTAGNLLALVYYVDGVRSATTRREAGLTTAAPRIFQMLNPQELSLTAGQTVDLYLYNPANTATVYGVGVDSDTGLTSIRIKPLGV